MTSPLRTDRAGAAAVIVLATGARSNTGSGLMGSCAGSTREAGACGTLASTVAVARGGMFIP
jgi:hypothetical protein